MPRKIAYSSEAHQELSDWIKTHPRTASKIIELLTECTHNPFEGKGKPEGLKGNLSGFWSRRITDDHRLVYKVDEEFV
jgi:toxin YoeB